MIPLPDEAWTGLAATWPVTIVSRETDGPRQISNYDPGTRSNFVTEHERLTQTHLVCVNCHDLPSVFCLNPGTGAYTVVSADLLAGILAHIRRSHPDIAPDTP